MGSRRQGPLFSCRRCLFSCQASYFPAAFSQGLPAATSIPSSLALQLPLIKLLSLPLCSPPEASLPRGAEPSWGRACWAPPWVFPMGCSTSPPTAGQHDCSRVKPHVFHLFEVLRHLLGTELQGTSALHETLTGSTTTQHSLLHTRHGHGAERGGTAATALPPRLPAPVASVLPRHRDSRICPWALLPWGTGSTRRCGSPEGFRMHCE